MDTRTGAVDYIPEDRGSSMATGLRRQTRGLFYCVLLVEV